MKAISIPEKKAENRREKRIIKNEYSPINRISVSNIKEESEY